MLDTCSFGQCYFMRMCPMHSSTSCYQKVLKKTSSLTTKSWKALKAIKSSDKRSYGAAVTAIVQSSPFSSAGKQSAMSAGAYSMHFPSTGEGQPRAL